MQNKSTAHYKTQLAVKKGILKRPSICEFCEKESKIIHAHHFDYNDCIGVGFLCTKCHALVHKDPNRTPVKLRVRKKQDKKMTTKIISFRLLPEEEKKLKAVGLGNLTEGIRRLLIAFNDNQKQTDDGDTPQVTL